MMEIVTKNYWWPGIIRDVEKYIKGYNMCQQMKNRTEVLVEKLKLSEVLKRLWMHLIVDLITKLPVVAGKNTILAVCN